MICKTAHVEDIVAHDFEFADNAVAAEPSFTIAVTTGRIGR
jgi:hypothetical protein